MIEESKDDRLEAFKHELEAEGYEVVDAEPQRRKTITEKIRQEEDDTVGFIVVNTGVELGGEKFDGELVITVHRDRLSNQGIDIRSHADDPLPKEKRDLLSEFVPPREVTDEDGETQSVWTYYPPPDTLPDDVLGDSRDNIDEVMAKLEAIYENVR